MKEKINLIQCPKCQHEFPDPKLVEFQTSIEKIENEYEDKILSLEQDKAESVQNAKAEGIKEGKKAGREAFQDLLDENVESENTILQLQKKLRKKNKSRAKIKAEIMSEIEPILKKQSQKEVEAKIKEIEEEAKEKDIERDLDIARINEEKQNLITKIDKLQKGTKITSQEVQGETGQNYTEELLRKYFPNDNLIKIKKGQKGGDFLLEVIYRNIVIDRVLIEVKTSSNSFQKAWINKAEGDMNDNNINLGVIVSYTIPDHQFDHVDKGIFIVGFNDLRAILTVLRTRVISEYRLKKIGENKNEKASRVYEFLKSEKFARELKKLIDHHITCRSQLTLEKAYANKMWAKREQQLDDQAALAMQFLGVIEAQGEPGDFNLIERELGLIETGSAVE